MATASSHRVPVFSWHIPATQNTNERVQLYALRFKDAFHKTKIFAVSQLQTQLSCFSIKNQNPFSLQQPFVFLCLVAGFEFLGMFLKNRV